jgi:YidC/Oxa1 family membrane protein insertase
VILQLATLLASGPTTTVAAAKKSSGSLLDPIAKPIAWVLAHIYGVVPNYGVAILILSVLWMILISPLTLKSTRSMLAMQKLQPKLKKLQEQHKNDRQAFAQAQMDLFREHQVSPFGSCLPMLLPMPVFFALFRVINGLSHIGKNGVADPKYLSSSTRMFHDIVAAHGHLNAFGMDLSHNAFSPHSTVAAAIPFWILLLIMAATSYMQTAQTMSRNPQAAQNPQMRMMKFLPLLFVIFCIKFPAGVILYYSMSNVCRIVQQDLMYRFDPKVKALVAQEVQEVEAMTHEIDERDAAQQRGPGYTPPRGISPAKTAGEGGRRPDAGGRAGSTGGRMKFRDLLASAAEQQRKTQEARQGGVPAPKKQAELGRGTQDGGAGTNGTGGSAKPGSPQSGRASNGSGGEAGGVGKAKDGPSNGRAATSSGQRSGGNRPAGNRQSGSRKNRKRRGR